MIGKIKKFFPRINSTKIFLLTFISLGYGLSTIITIYVVSTLVSTMSGLHNSELSLPIIYVTDFFKNNFGLDAKLSHIILGICSLTLMSLLGFTKIYFISKTCATARHELSAKVLEKSININSVFQDKTHAGTIKSLILDETMHVVLQLLKPVIEIMASSVFIFVLLLNLFFYNPKITIFASIIFGGAYLINYLLTKSSIKRHGQLRYSTNKQRFKKVDDALSLRLLSNVLKTIDIFTDRYSKDSKKMAYHQYIFEFIAQSPKIIIEAMIFLAVFLMVIIGLNDTSTKTDEITFAQNIVIFALTGLKMLPEFQRIYLNLGLLKYGSSSQEGILNVLNFKNLPTFEKTFKKISDERDLIISFNCDACYKGDEKILKKINLQVYEGDRIGITGKSGSGKTTLLSALMGIIPIEINGTRGFFKSDVKFGYLPQESSLFSGTILENIVMGRKLTDQKYISVKNTAGSLFPEFSIDNIDILLNRVIDDVSTGLSVGQKQRIGLLRAIYDAPEILILDEFTSALDKKNEEIIINYVDNSKAYKSLIIVGHRSTSTRICKNIYSLNDGNLAES